MDSGGSARVVIVGGGVAGLTAAALVGRTGARVTVCERAGALGGRAATHVRDGFHLNLGAHALYLGGAAARELCALGLPLAGGAPPSGWALRQGELHTLPTGAVSLMTTGLLSFGAKRRAGLLLSRLGRLDTHAIAGVSMAAWPQDFAPHADPRAVPRAVLRVASHC